MELEFVAGTGVTGNLKLKIDDASGSVGSILVAAFYSLSATGDIRKVPSINLEFGWAPKGLKKISTSKKNRIRTTNFYPRYLIINIDIEFSDKGKQEILITAKQDETGASSYISSSKSGLSPFAVIGPQPTVNIRLLQYYFYFNKYYSDTPLDMSLLKFGFYKAGTQAKKDEILKITREFYQFIRDNNNTDLNNIQNFKKEGIINKLYKKNLLFNVFENVNSNDFNEMKATFDTPLKKSYFNSYLVFCYILNKYVQTLEHIFLKNGEQKNVDFIVLPLYDEKQIDTSGLLIDLYDSVTEFCKKDINSGYDKKRSNDASVTVTADIVINKNDSWEDTLNRFAKLVKFNDSNETKKRSNLVVTIKRYDNKNPNISDSNRNDKEFYKTGPKEELIKKFESLKKMYKDKEKTVEIEKIDKFIKEIKEQTKDFVYIILTKGSPFLTNENHTDKLIAQSYTIYPKIKFQERIKDQNFNSGSEKNSLLEESFPDVIYFKPKMPFGNSVNSILSTANTNIDYNNGAFSFESKKIIIKHLNSEDKKFTIPEIIKIKEKLQKFLKLYEKDKKVGFLLVSQVPLKSDGQSFYTMNEINASIKIYHLSLVNRDGFNNSEEEDIESVNALIGDIDEYIDTISRGYHFSTLKDIIKKSNNISIGDNNTIEYNNYIDATDEYNKMLAVESIGFKAELKILGEPAFTFDFSGVVNIFIKVYNLNGSLNYLLTGLYAVQKIKHEISESGGFTTTLELMYQSAYSGK